MRYERHLFVCVNERPAGHPKGCCAASDGDAVRCRFKDELRARGLRDRVRANRAGCLDICEAGVTVVVYPDGIWYGRVTVDDVPEIIERHLVLGEPVERLRIPGRYFTLGPAAREEWVKEWDARRAASGQQAAPKQAGS